MISGSSDGSLTIRERVLAVRGRIDRAARRAGRDPAEITLVGVTKTQNAAAVCELIDAGVDVIGENRVQELLEKEPALAGHPHTTHLIGTLQRNKAKFLPGHVDMLQSLDSVKTLEALERVYTNASQKLDVLIEVNIGEETNKTGVLPRDFDELFERARHSPQLRLRGLMAIPPFGLGEGIRPYFASMRHLFVDRKAKNMDNSTVNDIDNDADSFQILSMGMSADFEIAIEEGATMVRVGTDLFGPRAAR